jgi:hypothetical protein
MKTIRLSQQLPAHSGGRPRKVGSIDFCAQTGRQGIFVGYDTDHCTKVVIDYDTLGDILTSKGYKVEYQAHITPLDAPKLPLGERLSEVVGNLAIKVLPSNIQRKMVQNLPARQESFEL